MSLCVSRNMNTGIDVCDISIGKIKRVVANPSDLQVTPSDGNNIFSFLQKNLQNVNPELRLYITPKNPNNITDSSSEPVIASLADGSEEQILPGNQIQILEWWSTIGHDRIINRFDGYNGPAFLITERGVVGVESGVNMKSKDIKISVSGGGLQTYDSSPQTKKMKINIGNELEFQNRLVFYPLEDSKVNLLQGLRDLHLSVVSATTGIANIMLTIGADKRTNVFDIPSFKTAFSSVANWRANGLSTVITSVTADAVNKSFELNTGTGTFVIDTAPIDVLKTAGVEGYEGISITVDVAA